MKVALIITTYNRPEYFKRCLESLKKLSVMPSLMLIVDDHSSEVQQLSKIVLDFQNATGITPIWITKPEKEKGIKSSLWGGCHFAIADGAQLLINLDPDTVVKPDFIKELVRLHKKYPTHIISGFNSMTKDSAGNLRNPILSDKADRYEKKYANGVNMCFTPAQYESFIKPALLGPGNWDSSVEGKFIISKPSLVQHIGVDSAMGHTDTPDFAADFYEYELPDVTLFGIDAHDPAGLQQAADVCTKSIRFGAVKIITERLFQGREGYSGFCITDMAQYIQTSHVLIIHPDGFIQNPGAWDPSWLQYDYIGATWQFKDGMNNGNGGFSLRSKKLLDILAKLDLTGLNVHPEDDFICRQIRPWLEREYGIKFAPEEVCNRFSIEAYGCTMTDHQGKRANLYDGQFGFHGYNVLRLPIQPVQKAVTSSARTNISVVNKQVFSQ